MLILKFASHFVSIHKISILIISLASFPAGRQRSFECFIQKWDKFIILWKLQSQKLPILCNFLIRWLISLFIFIQHNYFHKLDDKIIIIINHQLYSMSLRDFLNYILRISWKIYFINSSNTISPKFRYTSVVYKSFLCISAYQSINYIMKELPFSKGEEQFESIGCGLCTLSRFQCFQAILCQE